MDIVSISYVSISCRDVHGYKDIHRIYIVTVKKSQNKQVYTSI